MNAGTTVHRVLEWAARAGEPRRDDVDPEPLPAGPLREVGTLAAPPRALVAELAELTRRTAARLGAGSPPFGDPTPIGLGALLLAAAVGGRNEAGPARMLAEATAPPRLDADTTGWADALARHAVVAPALPELVNVPTGPGEEPLMETFLRYAPLTAVLHRPPLAWLVQEATAGTVAAARALRARPRGAAMLVAALAAFEPDPAVLLWRSELLRRLLPDQPELVADVYLAARLHHGGTWDAQVARTRRAFGRPGGPGDTEMGVARFWWPLALLRRRRPDLLAARPLMTGHKAVLALVEGPHQASIGAAA